MEDTGSESRMIALEIIEGRALVSFQICLLLFRSSSKKEIGIDHVVGA